MKILGNNTFSLKKLSRARHFLDSEDMKVCEGSERKHKLKEVQGSEEEKPILHSKKGPSVDHQRVQNKGQNE
jgi:hypothetical protein